METTIYKLRYLVFIPFFSLLGCDILTPSGSEYWTEYHLPCDGGYIYDIYFNGPSDGWACTSNGYIFRYDGTDWSLSAHFEPEIQKDYYYFNVFDIDFSTPYDGWAVARTNRYPNESGIFHYDGETWSDVTPEIAGYYGVYSVCARAPDDVWFGGPYGLLLHYNGASFKDVQGLFGDTIWAIQFVDDDFGIAMDGPQLVFYDGSSWSYFALPICYFPGVDVHGDIYFTSRDDGWVVGGAYFGAELGSAPLAWHFNGETWTEIDITDYDVVLEDVHSRDGKEIWVVGRCVWKRDGEYWRKIKTPPALTADCVHVTETDDVWVGCNNGTILKYKG